MPGDEMEWWNLERSCCDSKSDFLLPVLPPTATAGENDEGKKNKAPAMLKLAAPLSKIFYIFPWIMKKKKEKKKGFLCKYAARMVCQTSAGSPHQEPTERLHSSPRARGQRWVGRGARRSSSPGSGARASIAVAGAPEAARSKPETGAGGLPSRPGAGQKPRKWQN